MNIPNLPTDNLYKFIALGGIALIICAMTLRLVEYRDFNNSHHKLSEELVQYEVENEILKEKKESLDKEYKKASSNLNRIEIDSSLIGKKIDIKQMMEKLYDKEYREVLEFIFKYGDKYFSFISTEELDRKEKELNELYYEIIKKDKLIDENINQIEFQGKQLRRHDILYFIFVFLGSSASFFGFQLWYKRVQIFLDKKIENEASDKNAIP